MAILCSLLHMKATFFVLDTAANQLIAELNSMRDRTREAS